MRFAKIAVAASAALVLVTLYIGAWHFLSIESAAAGQTRVYQLDIGESCLRGTEPPPVFDAQEGDRVVLKVTSLYSGELYLHGLEEETNLVPGSETTVTFNATHAGRYYLHLHSEDESHAHTELAVLEIQPR